MKIIKNIRLNNGRPYHDDSPYWNERIIKDGRDVSTVVEDAIRATSEYEGKEWRNSFYGRIDCATDGINQIGDILVVPTKGPDGNVFYVETADVTKEENGDIRKFYCNGSLVAVECEGKYHFNWDGFSDYDGYEKLVSYDRWVAETEVKIDAIIKDEYPKFIGNVKKRLDGYSVTDIYISHDEYEGETYLVLKVNGETFTINLYR